MNRLTLALIAPLFVPFLSFGQNTFSVGPRVGVNLANVSNLDDAETLTGLVLGLTSTYSFSQTSGITLDLLYSREGYELPGSNALKVDYLQIPIYFDVFLGQLGDAFRPKFYVGVAAGFLLKAESAGVDIKEDMTSAVFSFTGGLGFNYRITDKTWLNVDLRSFLGLSDIRKDNLQSGDKIAARNVQPSVGIAFGL